MWSIYWNRCNGERGYRYLWVWEKRVFRIPRMNNCCATRMQANFHTYQIYGHCCCKMIHITHWCSREISPNWVVHKIKRYRQTVGTDVPFLNTEMYGFRSIYMLNTEQFHCRNMKFSIISFAVHTFHPLNGVYGMPCMHASSFMVTMYYVLVCRSTESLAHQHQIFFSIRNPSGLQCISVV